MLYPSFFLAFYSSPFSFPGGTNTFQKPRTGVSFQLWELCPGIQGDAIHRKFAEGRGGTQDQFWSGLATAPLTSCVTLASILTFYWVYLLVYNSQWKSTTVPWVPVWLKEHPGCGTQETHM